MILVRCPSCDAVKPASEFGNDRSRSTGRKAHCKVCVKVKLYAWRAGNKPKVAAINNRLYVKQKPQRIATTKKWQKDNPERTAAIRNNALARRRAKMHALGKIFSKENRAFYEMARRLTACTGIKHHVDHIEPLNGKDRSGLHVPWNLRVIPASVNQAKGNRV